MIRDPDENCVSNKELRDMMKVMIELLTKNQASTTTTSPFTISYCILLSLPSYDSFDYNKYFAWEIGMEKKFGQRRICERRKYRNIASASLTNNALSWWKLTIPQIFAQARGPVAALAHKAECGPM
jgi:hypothetical protein